MSDLIVVAFEDEATAFELRAALVKLQKEYLLEMEDVVVVTKSADGQVALHQAVNLTTGGAMGGGLWGTLIGLLFLNPMWGLRSGRAPGRCRASSPISGSTTSSCGHRHDADQGRRGGLRAGAQGDGRQGSGRT